MRYDLCLFDLDGTLTDPKLGITKSFQYALSSFGIYEELDDLTKFIGPPLRESFRESYGFSDADIEKAVAKFREYFTDKGIYENTVYPGIVEMLQELKSKGLHMAVATSKAALFANQILDYFDISGYFDFVSGDKMDGSLTKDGKREIIRIALSALDPKRLAAGSDLSSKMNAVIIGDRKHDIHGGREAGVDGIGVTWGYGSRAELEQAGAAWIAETPSELCMLILGDS